MGTSYETILVAAGARPVMVALSELDRQTFVVPVTENRTAVIPRENQGGYAETDDVATVLTATLGCGAVTFGVFDSDIGFATIYQDGRSTHNYVSDRSMLVEWFEDDDGQFKQMIDGVVPPADAPAVTGPAGADAARFAPFGLGQSDPQRLAAALLGDVDKAGRPRLFAEQQHWAIIEALNLDPRPLTVAYRHVDPADFDTIMRTGKP